MKKCGVVFAMLLFFSLSPCGVCSAQNAEKDGHWVSVWGASEYAPFKFIPGPPESAIADKTIRMVVRTSIGGSRLRIRLSNAFGSSALTVGAAHVALTDNESKILPGTDRALTFGGSPKVNVPVGAPAISDPIDLPIKPLAELSVSIYLPTSTSVEDSHRGAQHDSYISGPGDLTSSLELPNSEAKNSWYFLSSIEMWEPETTTTTVAFGDSITEGSNNPKSPYSDYPDQLAMRVARGEKSSGIAVVNEGIGGNRILHDGAGRSALARFDKDVLSHPGVSNLIVLLGVNDIGFPRVRMSELKIPNVTGNLFASERVSASEIIWGLQQIIARGHEHGIRVYGATIMPFEGTNAYDLEGNAIREEVNKWIRGANAFDRVFDFDELVRDPDHPAKLRAAFDSGDHIHPNPAGYKAMADAIPLSLLKGKQK
jgi:lysophospholipase L1-like esterase